MSSPAIHILTRDDEPAAIDTLVLAFSADPMMRWAWPDGHQYLTVMPRFLRAFGGQAFDFQGAHATDGCCGVALWLPPGANSDEQVMLEIMEESFPATRRDEVFSIMEQMEQHHPSERVWYLPTIGVDPAYQCQGHGDALLRHALEQCDRDGLPAYLEASSPRNIALYQRHGFEIIGTIQAGTSPPLMPMLRRPR